MLSCSNSRTLADGEIALMTTRGAALADVVLLCGAKESPLDSGSMPVKLAVLFVANVLVLRYTLDNQELANLSLSRTSRALGSKLL